MYYKNYIKIGHYAFFYRGKLAQWSISYFKNKAGIVFSCAEQAMMYRKAILFEDIETAEKILNEKSPKIQKQLGRTVNNFSQSIWDKKACQIVYENNYLKFSQNKDLLDILMETDGYQLVEASPIDCVWGIGRGIDYEHITDESTWRGKNWLGKVLTKVRIDLKIKYKL